MTSPSEPDDTTLHPVGTLASISIDCADPPALADFYGRLLGMHTVFARPDNRVLALSDGTSVITIMRVENHVPPSWPQPAQAKQMHLDIAVTDLPKAVAGALALGAVEAAHQPAPDLWRVLVDPAGHPFCLTTVRPD